MAPGEFHAIDSAAAVRTPAVHAPAGQVQLLAVHPVKARLVIVAEVVNVVVVAFRNSTTMTAGGQQTEDHQNHGSKRAHGHPFPTIEFGVAASGVIDPSGKHHMP